MINNVFSNNLKKFRLAKGYTQEEVAERLGVVAQTVSRWECNTSLPDVLMLPEIARLYAVTVDDLYSDNSVAYDNYAERLSAVYDKSRDPADFYQCYLEYQKMIKSGKMSANDTWNYAATHHLMMSYCKDEALKWYDKTLSFTSEKGTHAYRRAASMRVSLLFSVGQGKSYIREQEEKLGSSSTVADVREWILLLEAYLLAKRFTDAYQVYQRAISYYPDNWELYVLGGDACGELEQYDEAFACFRKAADIGTEFCDEKFLMAHYYKKLGQPKEAYRTYLEIADIYRKNGLDIEADAAMTTAREISNTINE